MQKLAKELGVVIPVSFFEEANNAHYNSVAIIDADGTDLGIYRKSHIPDGPGKSVLVRGVVRFTSKFKSPVNLILSEMDSHSFGLCVWDGVEMRCL